MPSKNLCCSWQLILLAAVVLRTDIVIADLEAQKNALKTTDSAMNTKAQSTVDSINSITSENDAMNVIRLQPPPLTRALLMPTPIAGAANTIRPIALDSKPNPTIIKTTERATAKTATAASTASLSKATAMAMSTSTTTSTQPALEAPQSEAAAKLTSLPLFKPAAMGINTNYADDFSNEVSAAARAATTISPPLTDAPAAMNSKAFYDDEDSSAAAAATATTQISNDAATLLHPPSSDSLTKGFTIPTFLPPVREFAVADLPSYLTTSTTTSATTMPDELLQQHDQLYQSAYNGHPSARKNLTLQSTNVSVQLGNHAYMPCNVRRLQNKPVSWVRVRDGHILAVDQTTFIADQRFQSIFNEEDENTWSLQIKYVQKSDEGWYECQVSTEPKMSSKMYLEVVVPTTELIGDQSRFVKAGSKVALHCIVRGTIVPPSYIIWFREKIQIIDDNKMGWFTQLDRNIFGNTSENHNTVNDMIGSLIIPSVRKKDSGNYTCQPANSDAVSVDLHVLSGEYSASAIMSSARTYGLNVLYFLLIFLLVALQKT